MWLAGVTRGGLHVRAVEGEQYGTIITVKDAAFPIVVRVPHAFGVVLIHGDRAGLALGRVIRCQ